MSFATVIADAAKSHPHFQYIPQVDNDYGTKPETTKRNVKDAFYGKAQTKAEKDLMDLAHQVRLAGKSGDGFLADLQLAAKYIINRLTCK